MTLDNIPPHVDDVTFFAMANKNEDYTPKVSSEKQKKTLVLNRNESVRKKKL